MISTLIGLFVSLVTVLFLFYVKYRLHIQFGMLIARLYRMLNNRRGRS